MSTYGRCTCPCKGGASVLGRGGGGGELRPGHSEGLDAQPSLLFPAVHLSIRVRPPRCFLSFSIFENRPTTADNALTFHITVWAYLGVDCSRLLLKSTKGMDKLPRWARTQPRGSSPAVVENLLVVPCKKGAGELGRDGSGTPHSLCDTCYAKRGRAARREATSSTPSASPYPPLVVRLMTLVK